MDKVFDKQLGLLLQSYRSNANMSQQDVADRLGITRSAIGHYERGERTVDIQLLYKLCDIYNVDINDVVIKIRKYAYKQ